MLSLKEYKKEYSRFKNICLNITNRCNLNCRYCFVNQNSEDMTLETAIQSVLFLYNNLNEGEKGTINFFGGEPLLLFDEIIVPVVEFINEHFPGRFNLGITTNGTLLDKKRIQFFYQNNVIPLLSMDGNKVTQDFNRSNSFDSIVENIPYLLEKFPNTVFRMTICEETCNNLFSDILFAESIGFKHFYATPDTRQNFSNFSALSVELCKYFEYLTASISLGIKPIETSIVTDMLLRILQEPSLKIKELDPTLPRDIMRCGLGTVSASIDPKGKISGCQEQVTSLNEDNIFYIGDIWNGIDPERHKKLLSEYRTIGTIHSENNELCNNCDFRKLCYQIQCPSMSMTRFNNMLVLPETLCYWNNLIYKLCKQFLSVYNSNIEKYLTELIEKEEQYELYCKCDNV